MPASVYIVSGFLGSGKTTFINSLLESAPSNIKITVLVNDFGNISIDGRLIQADQASIVDLSGGCICCGLFFELIASMRYILEAQDPDIILIESTGFAIPREIARQAVSPFFEGKVVFGGIITLIDAPGMDLEKYPLIKEQVKGANVVVLNKVDLTDARTLDRVRGQVRQLMPSDCVLYEATFGRVPYAEVLSKRYPGAPGGPQEGSPEKIDTTAGFSAICLVSHTPIVVEKLIQLYKAHGDKVLRSKGFLLTETGALELQFSFEGLDIRDAQRPVQRSELVLIVREADRDSIEADFKGLLGGPDHDRDLESEA